MPKLRRSNDATTNDKGNAFLDERAKYETLEL
jgi:hypothetical protein